MIMCVLLCYPVSIHMSQLLSTGRPISSLQMYLIVSFFTCAVYGAHEQSTLRTFFNSPPPPPKKKKNALKNK